MFVIGRAAAASTGPPSPPCCRASRGYTVLLDAGANVDPKPWHLFQFAVMGHVYARDILGIERPRVGLLSVGEEEGKGNELTREAFEQLKDSSLNFIGNVEGRDIYNGRCDVVVTDGFTGNVALKISESLAEMLGRHDPRGARRATCAPRSGAALAQPRVRALQAARGLHGDGRRAAARHRRRRHHLPRRLAGEGDQERACAWRRSGRKAGLNEHIKTALEAEVARGGPGGRPRMTRAKIIGVGAYAPKRILTNADLEKMVDTTDEWIVQRSGIRERHIVDESEATSDLAVPRRPAGARARQPRARGHRLHRGGHDHRRTCSSPPPRNLVQHRLGCRRAGSVDVLRRVRRARSTA